MAASAKTSDAAAELDIAADIGIQNGAVSSSTQTRTSPARLSRFRHQKRPSSPNSPRGRTISTAAIIT